MQFKRLYSIKLLAWRSTSGYETMTLKSMYTGDMIPLFSWNSPNLTACKKRSAGWVTLQEHQGRSEVACLDLM